VLLTALMFSRRLTQTRASRHLQSCRGIEVQESGYTALGLDVRLARPAGSAV
jgi:hypothetical protein